jgi:DNA oxidative demethylase
LNILNDFLNCPIKSGGKFFMLFPPHPIELRSDFWLLPAFINTHELTQEIHEIAAQAPFRHMQVANGKQMSVAMTNCGALGWTSSASGYAYYSKDPQTGQDWPAMPDLFSDLAASAVSAVGWGLFIPDACLINRYSEGASMGLHQDRDEKHLAHPIVSVSIGACCKFVVGGLARHEPTAKIELNNGDVLVWGKSARLAFHGVRPLKSAETRYNLTFRKAD